MVAVIGENRKMLVFPLDEVNEMARGKGVHLQRYSDGGLSDVRVFRKADGLLARSGAGMFDLLAEPRYWGGRRRRNCWCWSCWCTTDTTRGASRPRPAPRARATGRGTVA